MRIKINLTIKVIEIVLLFIIQNMLPQKSATPLNHDYNIYRSRINVSR